MLARDKSIFFSTLFGWLLAGGALAVRYVTSAEIGCSFASRFNIIESRAASVLFVGACVCFSISAYYAWAYVENPATAPSKFIKYLPLLSLLGAFIAIPFNTHDLSYYFSAGRAAHEGVNVYTEAWTMENYFICPSPKNTGAGIMYGPLSVFLFEGVYRLSADNLVVFIIIWKMLMVFATGLAAWLAARLAKYLHPTTDRRIFYLVWFAQPLLLWEWVANGHFDIVWLVLVLAAIIYALKQRWWLVLICLAIGTWIKFIPLLMAPWFALWWWQSLTRQTWRKSVLSAAVGIVASAVITYISWLGFWQGRATITPIILQTKWAVTSIFSVLYYSSKGLFVTMLGANAHWYLTRLVHAIVLVFAWYLLWPLVKRAWRVVIKKDVWELKDFLVAIFISMLVYLSVWQKSFWPWYISWLLPFGIILVGYHNHFIKKMSRWLGIAPLYFYAIWLFNHHTRHTDAPSELWFYYVIVALVWVVPVALLVKWRRIGYALTTEKAEGGAN